MIDFSQLSLTVNIGLFVLASVVIAFAGWKLAAQADRLADATGLGEAIAGALFLGAATSLPGIMTSGITAWRGFPEARRQQRRRGHCRADRLPGRRGRLLPEGQPRARRRFRFKHPPRHASAHPLIDSPDRDLGTGDHLPGRPPGFGRNFAGLRLRHADDLAGQGRTNLAPPTNK